MEKINIAELLKDCPRGMELYSPIFGDVYLDKIRPHLAIAVTTDKEQGDFKEEFLYDGRYGMNGECMLFPSKDKTTWEGFHRPFKDGDIAATDSGLWLGIIKNKHDTEYFTVYCALDGTFNEKFLTKGEYCFSRFATEEEKQKLFQAIKDNGYKWNYETKTLEKLVEPKFKVGDIIQDIDAYKVKITEINIDDECYSYESIIAKGIGSIPFKEQDNWKLVPDKFDITNLKPFESRVLVRNDSNTIWKPAIFGCHNYKTNLYYALGGMCWICCIPYEGNEHLLGTTNDCDEYFKTWKL